MQLKLTTGSVYEVSFLDHVSGQDDLMTFTVYGRLVAHDDTKLVIDSWAYTDAGTSRDRNVEQYAIVRSAVQDIYKLERVKA